jgi:DNA-binding MarR family transcriptional regulator
MTTHDAASFGTALRRLIDQLDGAVEQAYHDDGLDFRPRFTPIVRALVADGPQTIRALSATLGVSHSAVSQTITQMVARGLVTVTTGRDARQRIVALGDAGTALLPRLRRHWAATTAATAALDMAADSALIAAINRANTALEARPFGEWLTEARLAVVGQGIAG